MLPMVKTKKDGARRSVKSACETLKSTTSVAIIRFTFKHLGVWRLKEVGTQSFNSFSSTELRKPPSLPANPPTTKRLLSSRPMPKYLASLVKKEPKHSPSSLLQDSNRSLAPGCEIDHCGRVQVTLSNRDNFFRKILDHPWIFLFP